MNIPDDNPPDDSAAPDNEVITTSSMTSRPRRPRDWRFWVGGTGRVLMVIGVLMFGFVGYQLWGTGIEYRQHQDELADEFAALQAEFENSLDTSTTAPSSTAPGTTSPDTTTLGTTAPETTAGTTIPATTGPDTTAPDTTVPDTTGPDTTAPDTTGPDTTVPGSTVPGGTAVWPSIRRGQVLSVMEIPRINKRIYALHGVRASDLKRGLGHFPNTPLPGEYGNSAFAGHRTTFGAPLFDIDRLAPGDEIIVTTITNRRYVYVVDARPKVVRPSDLNVIVTTDSEVARITLTSCHPRWSAEQRIVVSAVLDPTQSAPAQFPQPKPGTGSGSGDPLDGGNDDPTASDFPNGDTAGYVDDSLVDGAPGDNPTDIGGSGDSDDDPNDYRIDADTFARGWFDDSAAWWHIAGWGALDSSVVAAGWLLARRTRRWWLGTLVAAVPFVVVLYFVYQNINRLLPPAL